MKYDVIIIGAGASGLCLAVSLKQKYNSLSILLIERLSRVGKKLALTGNGRCNISNKSIIDSNYYSHNMEFCNNVLFKYNLECTKNFFNSIGVPIVYEGNKAYPSSLQASSVVDCLRFECEKAGVYTVTDVKVTDIIKQNGFYECKTTNNVYTARCVTIASGLLSGGEKLGCDGSMLKLLKEKKFKTFKTFPAIVQLKTENSIVRQLKGIKINAMATLCIDGESFRKEYGEVLFCDYGLSGPPILQLSGSVNEKKDCIIKLDFYPDLSLNEVLTMLLSRVNALGERSVQEFFTGMINKRLGQILLKSSGCTLNEISKNISKSTLKNLAYNMKNFSFKVIGNNGYNNSQVTIGGLDTSEFSSESMMSNHNKGFFAIGEILDVTGDCGGYNLQWAWSSAMCASDGIIKYLGVKK